mgnify:CR=1 FL=1
MFKALLLLWLPAALHLVVVGGPHGGTTTEQIVGGLLGVVFNAFLYAWGVRLIIRRLQRRWHRVSVEGTCLKALSVSALLAGLMSGYGMWVVHTAPAARVGAAYLLAVAGFSLLAGAVALAVTIGLTRAR